MTSHNEMEYRKTINVDFEYKITVEDFRKWLDTHNEYKAFISDIKHMLLEKDIDELYGIAWDFNIPIIMVKYFIPIAINH